MPQISVVEPTDPDDWHKCTIESIKIEAGTVRLFISDTDTQATDDFSVSSEEFREIVANIAPSVDSPREYLIGEVIWYTY